LWGHVLTSNACTNVGEPSHDRRKAAIAGFIASQMSNAESQWSLGTFGAIAEYSRDPLEPVVLGPHAAVTERGGISLTIRDDLRLLAFETVTRESWSTRVALCLPRDASAMNRRSLLTELGPDHDALRPQDRSATLFDVGIDAWQTDVCIRVHDPAVVARLRAHCGTTTFAPESVAARIILETSPHRVFISRVGRAEVYQPIPPVHGRSPEGPHTHVLVDLLRHRRTHAATEPIPPDLVPCAHIYPAHPSKDAMGHRRPFDAGRQAEADAILRVYGEQRFVELKQRVRAAVAEGRDPNSVPVAGRFVRTTIRVALRQLRDSGESLPALPMWLAMHDAASAQQEPDERHLHHR
jgi:hypothetical protein